MKTGHATIKVGPHGRAHAVFISDICNGRVLVVWPGQQVTTYPEDAVTLVSQTDADRVKFRQLEQRGF